MSPQSDDEPHRKSSEAQSTEEAGKKTEKTPKDSAKGALILPRESVLICGAIIPIGLVAGLIGAALVEGLGWQNLGPLATWVAAALTLAAVIVALQSSQRSVQAINEARQRAEDDRRFAINRQSALAVADMWAALLAIRPPFESAAEAMRHPRWREPGEPAGPDVEAPVNQSIAAASAAVFFARSVIEEGTVLDLVDKIDGLFREFRTKWNTRGKDQDTREWLRSVNLALAEIEFTEQLAVRLARDHLPMSRTQEERIERDAEDIEFNRTMWEYLHAKGWRIQRIHLEHTWGDLEPGGEVD